MTKAYSESTGLAFIEEAEVQGETKQLYEEIKRGMHVPSVPNILKVMANSPAAIAGYWNAMSAFYRYTVLPESLTAMILYCVAHANECQYCSAGHELACRTLGVNEETLEVLIRDLPKVSPERIRAIMEFAIKAARDPKGLNSQDYEHVRDHGVTDDEIVEIVFVAAMGNLGDTLADALKVEVDAMTIEGLGR